MATERAKAVTKTDVKAALHTPERKSRTTADPRPADLKAERDSDPRPPDASVDEDPRPQFTPGS